MRTYTLSRELGDWESACDYLETQLTRTSNDGNGFRARYTSITGLFMLDKPLCVRADLTKHLGWHEVKGEGSTPKTFLPESIKEGIKLWYNKGTGTPIIHMRSYTPRHHISMGESNKQSINESFPHKIDGETFFYHIGKGYGHGKLWNAVHVARETITSVPEAVYERYRHHFYEYKRNMEMYLGNGTYQRGYLDYQEEPPEHWGKTFSREHEFDDHDRTFAVFKWKNGKVFDVYTNAEIPEEESSLNYFQSILIDEKLSSLHY